MFPARSRVSITLALAAVRPRPAMSADVAPERVAMSLPADVVEIVFAVRPFGSDPHYYANFGYYCDDPSTTKGANKK